MVERKIFTREEDNNMRRSAQIVYILFWLIENHIATESAVLLAPGVGIEFELGIIFCH